jgi:RPA family protein
MTKNVVLIIAIVLFIVAIAGWTFAVNERYTIFQRDREIADLFVISTAQAQIQTTSIARESNNSTAQAQIHTTSEAQQSLLQIATEAFSSVTQTANIQYTVSRKVKNYS